MKRFYEDLELRSFVVLHYLNTILIECVTFAFKSVFFQQLTVQMVYYVWYLSPKLLF